ncbi:MAG: GNAT family N-acetyltransferase [Jatrophihabitans sp.]
MEPSWVGRRVSVRRIVDDDLESGGRHGDVVGDLIGLDARTAVVETRRGLVEIALPSVLIARLVPASTAAELALEGVIARGLRPIDDVELDGWTLRADLGFTRRANSVLPLRQLRLPLADALEQARAWYVERGLPLVLRLPTEARRLLDAELGERGWRPHSDSHVMIARLDRLGAPGITTPPVSIDPEPDDAWLELYRGGEGASEAGRALLTRHDRVAFASLRLDGRTVAVGRAVVDDGWLGVTAIEVDLAHRRQGLATAVTAELWNWGRSQQTVRSYLQVLCDNVAGVQLYAGLGYWAHHDYRYREDPVGLPG